MLKRVLATALWFYAMWYGWSILANATGLPELMGPIIGLAVGAFIGLDPTHRIWTKRAAAEPAARSTLEPETA